MIERRRKFRRCRRGSRDPGLVDPGEPIGALGQRADLYDQMFAARQFLSGLGILRQVKFALFDLLLHLDTTAHDPIAVLEKVRDEVAVMRPPDWHRFPHSFSHIFAGDFAAGYYDDASLSQSALNWQLAAGQIAANLAKAP